MSQSSPRSAGMVLLTGALAGILALAGAGCAGELDPNLVPGGGGGAGGGGGGQPCDAYNMILVKTSTQGGCAGPGCHAASFPAAGLDLATAGVAARLLAGMPDTAQTGSICATAGVTKKYLDTGSNPATGLFLDKVVEATATCGTVMPPPGFTPLTADQLTCLRSWSLGVTSGQVQ